MRLESLTNILISLQADAEDKEVKGILTRTRFQLEDLLVRDAEAMLSIETCLPTKTMKVHAYQNRTQCSATVANIVVNRAWREEQQANSRTH